MKYNSKVIHNIDKFTVLKEMVLNVFRPRRKHDDILIMGEEKFIEKTISVLDFLEEKDEKAYKLINNYLDGISIKNNFPYISAKHVTKICFVGKEIAFGPRESYASLLAEQAYYLYLYEKVKKENPGLKHIPGELWYKGKAEKQALEFRKSILENLGASEELLDYVNHQIEQIRTFE